MHRGLYLHCCGACIQLCDGACARQQLAAADLILWVADTSGTFERVSCFGRCQLATSCKRPESAQSWDGQETKLSADL